MFSRRGQSTIPAKAVFQEKRPEDRVPQRTNKKSYDEYQDMKDQLKMDPAYLYGIPKEQTNNKLEISMRMSCAVKN